MSRIFELTPPEVWQEIARYAGKLGPKTEAHAIVGYNPVLLPSFITDIAQRDALEEFVIVCNQYGNDLSVDNLTPLLIHDSIECFRFLFDSKASVVPDLIHDSENPNTMKLPIAHDAFKICKLLIGKGTYSWHDMNQACRDNKLQFVKLWAQQNEENASYTSIVLCRTIVSLETEMFSYLWSQTREEDKLTVYMSYAHNQKVPEAQLEWFLQQELVPDIEVYVRIIGARSKSFVEQYHQLVVKFDQTILRNERCVSRAVMRTSTKSDTESLAILQFLLDQKYPIGDDILNELSTTISDVVVQMLFDAGATKTPELYSMCYEISRLQLLAANNIPLPPNFITNVISSGKVGFLKAALQIVQSQEYQIEENCYRLIMDNHKLCRDEKYYMLNAFFEHGYRMTHDDVWASRLLRGKYSNITALIRQYHF